MGTAAPDTLIFGIVLAVFTFWLFAQSTLNPRLCRRAGGGESAGSHGRLARPRFADVAIACGQPRLRASANAGDRRDDGAAHGDVHLPLHADTVEVPPEVPPAAHGIRIGSGRAEVAGAGAAVMRTGHGHLDLQRGRPPSAEDEVRLAAPRFRT